MDNLIEFIGNRYKREILFLLKGGEMEVGRIVSELKISQPQVSMVLKELRDIKVVSYRIEGKKRIYRVDNEKLSNYVEILRGYLQSITSGLVSEIIVRR